MNRRNAIAVVWVAVLSLLITAPGLLLWLDDRQQQLNHDLVAAVKRQDTHLAMLALQKGADANARDEPNRRDPEVSAFGRIWSRIRSRQGVDNSAGTPLLVLQEDPVHRPADVPANDNAELTAALLAHGALVDPADIYGRTPLFFALVDGRIASVSVLIEHGAKLCAGPTHSNLLSVAISNGCDVALMEFMLRHGADPNLADDNGQTPLGQALYRGDPDIVEWLLRQKADPNRRAPIPNSTTTRPLEYAEHCQMTEIVRLLKAVGAK